MLDSLTKQNSDIVKQLEQELSELQNRFQMAHELKVKWLPDNNSKKSGEVIGKTIFIYEEDEGKALDTLRHEFLDYILTNELIKPSQGLINKLIALFEEVLYEKKERLIEKLLKVI